MRELLYVFIGGGTGAVIRYCASLFWRHLQLHPHYSGIIFPWPTLIVNVIGCLLISLFYSFGERWGFSAETRLMLTTGFCGGLTTFSTFSYETISLVQGGHYMTALLYVMLSLAIGTAAIILPFLQVSGK